MGQKTDTLDRQKTRQTDDVGTTTEEPPSWKELSKKADASDRTRDTVVLSATAVAIGFLAPIPGGWATAMFVTALIGSTVGIGDAVSGAMSGAIVLGVTAFFGSIIASILTLGTLTVLPAAVIGLVVGAVGGFLGTQIRK